MLKTFFMLFNVTETKSIYLQSNFPVNSADTVLIPCSIQESQLKIILKPNLIHLWQAGSVLLCFNNAE